MRRRTNLNIHKISQSLNKTFQSSSKQPTHVMRISNRMRWLCMTFGTLLTLTGETLVVLFCIWAKCKFSIISVVVIRKSFSTRIQVLLVIFLQSTIQLKMETTSYQQWLVLSSSLHLYEFFARHLQITNVEPSHRIFCFVHLSFSFPLELSFYVRNDLKRF